MEAAPAWFIDLFLHLDRHLGDAVAHYHGWVYALLFAIIFAETGFVVTPFLPGDSLLFGAGALAAMESGGTLRLPLLVPLLALAAIGGNGLNYSIGRWLGPRAFTAGGRWFRRAHLEAAAAFFERHGAMAVMLSRFAPLVRTFVPFVAGIGCMHPGRFLAYNIVGGSAWVLLFTGGGYLFGNLPWVQGHFGAVTLGIVVVSLLPFAWALLAGRFATGNDRG
jgi:membrane-associated protein